MTNKVTLPPLPLTGGCQCGNIKYTLNGPPVVFYICHCTECQKQSSSAFGESFRVNRADLKIEGELKTFSRSSASGNIVECDFCPNCGSRLFHRRAAYSDNLNIKAGSLDDASWLKPAGHIWTGSKQAWIKIPDNAFSYDKHPDNYDALTVNWKNMTSS